MAVKIRCADCLKREFIYNINSLLGYPNYDVIICHYDLLHEACRTGTLDNVKHLEMFYLDVLDQGLPDLIPAEPAEVIYDMKDCSGKAPIHHACENLKLDIVKYLLSYRLATVPDIKFQKDYSDEIKKYLQDYTNAKYWTAKNHKYYKNKADIIETLIIILTKDISFVINNFANIPFEVLFHIFKFL